jgi:uncharacterized membrane protein
VSRISPYLLAATLAGVGATHFRRPAFYDQMIPEQLPGPARAWTYGSGVAELVLAAAVVNPRTRRKGALATAAFLVGVFPGNLQMARDAQGAKAQAVTYARLPMQLPLVRWAWRVSRAAAR